MRRPFPRQAEGKGHRKHTTSPRYALFLERQGGKAIASAQTQVENCIFHAPVKETCLFLSVPHDRSKPGRACKTVSKLLGLHSTDTEDTANTKKTVKNRRLFQCVLKGIHYGAVCRKRRARRRTFCCFTLTTRGVHRRPVNAGSLGRRLACWELLQKRTKL